MDIEDSSVPYRAFLRSGAYPALTQRVLRSGGVLAQAAGWFALVVTAASAGYTLTQRFSTPSAASGSVSIVRPAPRPLAKDESEAAIERVENTIVAELPEAPERRAPVRKRAGAVAPVMQPSAAGDTPKAEAKAMAAPEPSAPAPSEQPPEQERVQEPEIAAAAAEPAPAPSAVAPDPIEAVLRDSIERQRASHLAMAMKARAAKLQHEPPQPERIAAPAPPSQPLTAAAKVDGVSVRGPLSGAQLRRSVERVRPALSECYGEAARRAGQHRLTPVRVTVTIDEAGRVKDEPSVEGAQLPGFGECLSSAMSKLVCQAPDTGTARAAVVLGWSPQR